jgi:hypothetical protein
VFDKFRRAEKWHAALRALWYSSKCAEAGVEIVMIEPPNKKEIAEFLRLGLRVRAFDYSAAIQWADSVLLMEEKPDIQIVEVSLSGAGGLDKTITCLKEVKGVARQDLAAKLLLAYCWKKIREKEWTDDYCSVLLCSLKRSGEASQGLEIALINLDENLSLAEDGVYGSVEDALKDIREFLKSFEQYVEWLPAQV